MQTDGRVRKAAPYSGMFPCLRTGLSSCLVFNSSSARISIGRVLLASTTSSSDPRAAAR